MALFIYDIYVIVLDMLDLDDQMSLKRVNKWHLNNINSELIIECQQYIKALESYKCMNMRTLVNGKYNNLFKYRYGDRYRISIRDFIDDICDNNNKELLEWAYNKGAVKNFSVIFSRVCLKGSLDCAKFILSLLDKNFIAITHGFRSACESNHLHIVKWLYSIGYTKIYGNEFSSELNNLYICATHGSLDVAKWMLSTIKPEYNEYFAEAIFYTMIHCQLEFAKWLFEIIQANKINIDLGKKRDIFFIVKENPTKEDTQLEILKLIHIINSAYYSDLYVVSKFFNGKFYKIGKWLCEIGLYNELSINESIVFCIEENNLDMVIWLYNFAIEKNINVDDIFMFKNICINRQSNILNWFIKTYDLYKNSQRYYHLEVYDDDFDRDLTILEHAFVYNNIDILKKLYDVYLFTENEIICATRHLFSNSYLDYHELIIWLYSIVDVPLVKHVSIFQSACESAKLPTIKFLLNAKPLDDDSIVLAFQSACRKNNQTIIAYIAPMEAIQKFYFGEKK